MFVYNNECNFISDVLVQLHFYKYRDIKTLRVDSCKSELHQKIEKLNCKNIANIFYKLQLTLHWPIMHAKLNQKINCNKNPHIS